MSSLEAQCSRRLSNHRSRSPQEVLSALAANPAAAEPADFYGAGGAATQLEQRTAELLGKPAAMLFIKGMIAQMSVLRAAAEQARTLNVAIHPMSHIDLDEAGAAWRIHNLRPIRLGRYSPFGVADLETITEPIAAIVVELPLRRSGYLLPPIDALRAISSWARQRSIHLHFDGARMWEAAAGYGVPLADLTALTDSIYVSFYKGLGGLGGAVVAGEADFVRSLAIWKTRHGANLYRVFPYAISALAGLETHLPRMPEYVDRARALAELLSAEQRLTITPRVPGVNAFHLLLPASVKALTERNREFAKLRDVWLFNGFLESPVEGRSIGEIVIGDSSDDYDLEEAAGWIRDFLDVV